MPPAESSHAQRVLSSLNQQRAVGRFCDAVLNVGGGVVYLAHRSILACFSDLFQQSNMAAAPCMEFCLQECPKDGLELLLNFLYTGELKLEADNLEKVQHAAASLGVPEALSLCQQFKENPADSQPFKHTIPNVPVKEENLLTITKVESSFDATTADLSMTSGAATTTTRSGRVVKGPRRLVTDDSQTTDFTDQEKGDEMAPLGPNEAESGVDAVESQNPDQLTGETEVSDLQIDLNDNKPGSLSPSTSTAQKRKAQSKTDKSENGEAVEEDSKKDCVLCPICNKSFRSKYYLKVHNRRHTGERPFGCAKCGKRYFRKENLSLHEMKDCAKVQTYTCVTCSSTFNGKVELRLHVVSHTGNMPHKCSSCPEQFICTRKT
ncbi:hypothetical protein KUCAC02_012002 [Chaenocephalus aceratus]|uniref:Uncharacterized protein n=1 Tax=Chaenocephalus aceratus TaxID=36190 RepID=A0ACB9XAL3_CHAAC|nr:hypothetical protein KUCAC02_012002 [Chaenocephalus aceratus]